MLYDIHGDVESPGAGVTVTVTNENTSESDTYATGSNGEYSVDISSWNPAFPTGHTNNDVISVSASGYVPGSGTVDTSGYPTGIEIDIFRVAASTPTTIGISSGWDIVTEIEKSSGDLYYPKTSEAIIRTAMPYDVNTATIRVAEEISALSNISIYDQVKIYIGGRLMFSGRVDTPQAQMRKSGASFEYQLSDHGQVLKYMHVSTLKSWATPTAMGTIIENIRNSFIGGDLTGTNISTGPNISEYNVPAWSKDILSVYQELAKIAGYNLWVDWNKDINFAVKQTTAIDGFAVVEGQNLIALTEYERDVWQVRNYIKVIGDTGFSAVAQDTPSQTAYHKREFPYTDPSLGSNAVCQEMADALLQTTPSERINCIVSGDLNVSAGDLVSVDIPKYSILDDFYVAEVEHRVNKNTFETGLQLGQPITDIMRIIASVDGRIKKIEGGYT